MSLASVGPTASQGQSLGNLLLQQLNALGTRSQATSLSTAPTAATGDQVTVSPAAQQLTQVLSHLQSGATTQGADGSPDSRSALLTTLMNGQSNQSNPAALLKLLNGPSNQDSLFSFLGNSDGAVGDASGARLG